MARFDLYGAAPPSLYVDVQNDYFHDFGHRIVVPLLPLELVPRPIPALHPVFEIGAGRYVLVTHRIGPAPRRQLGPPIGSMAEHADAITRAMDVLFSGF